MSSNDANQIRPTSTSQYAAVVERRLPVPELVADRVWAIAAPMPAGNLTHTLSYVLLDDDGHFNIIDPGWDSTENLASLNESLMHIGLDFTNLTTIIATHHHPDHLGIAERLRRETHARLIMSRAESAVLKHQVSRVFRDATTYAKRLEGWGVPQARRTELLSSFARLPDFTDVAPDAVVDDGDEIVLGSHRLRVLVTPGHTGGHLCLIDDERALLYSGDHVLPQVYGGIGLGAMPGSSPLEDYITSLEALEAYHDYQALPGHEYRFEGIRERTHQIAAHHLRRTRAIVALADELGDAPIWEFAKRLPWTGGWENLDGFFLHSALVQTEMHYALSQSGNAAAALERYPDPEYCETT